MALLACWVNEDLAARRMAVLAVAHRHKVKSAAGLMAVLARWRDFESASGLTVVLTHRRDVESAAELTAVLACRSLARQQVGGGADSGACFACSLGQQRVGGEADGGVCSLGR